MEVVRVAVCDDDRISIERICEEAIMAFKKAKMQYQIYKFESGKAFLEDLKNNEYDLILLDIRMPEVNGFNIAQEVYRMTGCDNLVFVSSEEMIRYEVFEFRPRGYVKKSDLHNDFEKTFRQWYDWFNQKRMISFTMGRDREEMHLRTDDIMYIEARGHYVTFHTKYNQYDEKALVSKYAFLQEMREFVRCNRSIICNLRYVVSIRGNNIHLSNAENLSIGRTYHNQVWDKYNEYVKYESMGG